MDIEQFTKDVTLWSNDALRDQYVANLDTRELCWDNAESYSADEEEYYRWLDEYEECQKILAVLRQEAKNRNINLPQL